MADQRGHDRGMRFPRMQNDREQFNETHDNSFGAHTLRTNSYSMNQNVTDSSMMMHEESNTQNSRFRNVNDNDPYLNPINIINSPNLANADHERFQSPSHDNFRIPVSNVGQPIGSFSKQTNCDQFYPHFQGRTNSSLPIRPMLSSDGNVTDNQHQFLHQSPSQMGPPMIAPRMQTPVNYPPQHACRPSSRMTHPFDPPPARPPPVHPPYPQQSFSHPPPPLNAPMQVGSNVIHSPLAPNIGYQDVRYSQQKIVPPQSNQSSLSHEQHNQDRTKKSSTQTQKDIDEKWITNWLLGKLGKKTTDDKQLKIREAQDIIQKSMVLLATLQKQKKLLQSLLGSANPETWQHEMATAEETKIQLQIEQKKLTDEVIDNLELKLLTRRKKRERMKRKRKADYEEKLREEKSRELKHEAMDKWRRQIVQKHLEDKQNKEIKASADVFLSEVRKKLSDVKKSTDLLNALQKLRKIRKDFAEKQGRYSSVEYDENFQKMVDNLTKLLKKQQDLYLEEEKTLKIMLENDWVEALEKEKEEKEHIDLVRQKRERRKHQEMLFGKQEIPAPNGDLYQFYQYYMQGKQNLDSLLQIRHGWDMYLVPDSFPGGSRIPDSWVLPPEPSSETWASALKH